MGKSGGENTNKLGTAEIPAHNHPLNYINEIDRALNSSGTTATSGSSSNIAVIEGESYRSASTNYWKNVNKGGTNTIYNDDPFIGNNVSGGYAHNNTPSFFALNFIIKYA